MLTDKQARFVEEYLIDLNATQAAIRAGYAESSAKDCGWENLQKPAVQAALHEAMDARSKRTAITADRVLQELAHLGFARMDDYAEWGPKGVTLKQSEGLTEDQLRAVGEVSETVTQHGGTIRFKLHDKLGALEKLGKHLGLFVERVEHSGSVNTGVLVVPESPDNWHDAVRDSQASLTGTSANRVAAVSKAQEKGNGKKNGDRP